MQLQQESSSCVQRWVIEFSEKRNFVVNVSASSISPVSYNSNQLSLISQGWCVGGSVGEIVVTIGL